MTAGPLLYLPKSMRPSKGWEAKGAPPPAPAQRLPSKQKIKRMEAFGRKVGATAGAYMDDLSSQHKAIWLCFQCRHKFDYKAAHYFYEKNLRVQGRCDGCREHRADSHLFIHESTICDQGGLIRNEHVWTPR